jgi:hypothetical protein
MSSIVHLPEQFKIVVGTPYVTTNAEVTCDYVSLKNVNMAWIVLQFLNAAGVATVINPRRATAVGPAGSVVIAHNAPNWLNESTAVSDTLVRGADGTTVTTDAEISNKLVVIQIDPAQLGETYDVLGCVISASGQVTDFVAVEYYLETRYGQATPPTAILD